MELVTVKILVLLISGSVRMFFGILPFAVTKLVARSWNKKANQKMKKVISFLMFFGGGVLLATCFLHMMPEVRDNFRTAEPTLELPLSEIVFVCGFFLVYMIEDIVHSIIHQRRTRKSSRKSSKEGKGNGDNNNTCKKPGMGNQQQQQTSNVNVNCGAPSGTVIIAVNEPSLHNNDVAISCKSDITTSRAQSHPLSLSSSSSPPEKMGEGSIPLPSRQGNNIFNGEDVPDLQGNGFTNGAFVHEGFQHYNYDEDWLRDMVCTPPPLSLPRGRRSICSGLICMNFGDNNSTTMSNNLLNQRNNENNNVASTTSNRHNSLPNSKWRNGEQSPKSKEGKNNGAHLHIHSPHSSSDFEVNHQHNDHGKHDHSHSHSHMPLPEEDDIDQSIGAEIRNVLIVIAISFHGIFEGMAIGLQGSEGDVWYLFLAVSLHECTILFCVGVEMISSKTKVFRMILYILVVSLVSPIGIAIGIIITERANNGLVLQQALIVGCFQGLAAGTLLYVTFFEIFQEEGKKLHRKYLHILVAILGFILMGSLEFMGAHEHGADEHGSLSSSNCSSPDHDNLHYPGKSDGGHNGDDHGHSAHHRH